MARNPKYDILFEPMRIGPKTMRNRFYKTPHCSNFGSDWPGRQAYLRAMAAEGGWAACSTEYCSIHPSSDDQPFAGARLWDDNDVRNLCLMCEKLHEHDSLAGVELWYGGAHQANHESRMASRGVSQIVSDFHWLACCYEMDRREIRELQQWYVDAARRARSAGFDIVNVYGGHGHPITYQFLEPYYNTRTDEYGGRFENRARFWRETIELVKEAVGDDCTIAVRACLDSLRDDDGLRLEETIQFIELVDHLVDIWDLQLGGVIGEWGEDTLSSRFAPQGYERPWVEQVRPHTTKPIVGVGRFTSPDVMVDMIRNGPLDVIGSARGSIADPFLPSKIEEGRLDEIRECIGCNVCAGSVMHGAHLICTQNATAGEEYRRGWHPERFSRAKNADSDVLVVGAGPAGMECAIVLGKRQMRRVHLVEACDEMGGAMRWIRELPGLGEWGRVVDYRKIQIEKLRNVEFIPSTLLDAQAVQEYGAEIVIIASGAHWASDGLNFVTHKPIPGADASQQHVLTPEQIMVEGKQTGRRVLVYDCDGYYMGVGLAETLARVGKEVTFVTPHSQIAPYTYFTLEGPRINRTLHSLGVHLFAEHMLTRVEPELATGSHIYSTDRPLKWRIDNVVLVTQRISSDALYRVLREDTKSLQREGVTGFYRIGDCVAPRLIADAVFDGHRLAREIDADDPATPLPFIRENRVLGASDDDYDGVLEADGAGLVVSSRLKMSSEPQLDVRVPMS
jgi:dimethylamine/trimethylamine dehydrogenase